eukprot:TRINITY_DN22398_c0_g1_i1.p1 TRINITY_DN22398_c0_g1~~TRINITY_DN22398_c0_g1_i1.p1  ORF type:complete len:125 (-),score=37.55 TRINITY_DN22398_c0_g1_i1:57-431(-)
MGDFEAIGKQFVEHYYGTFDQNRRADLAGLYRNESMLTFEAERMQGVEAIIKKLTTLAFGSVVHKPTTIDSQPAPGGGVMVFVCGNMIVDGKQEIKFSQVFCLQPIPGQAGGLFILNDLFKVNH